MRVAGDTWKGFSHKTNPRRNHEITSRRAIYKDGTLIFTQPELIPRDGTEVILTYLDEGSVEVRHPVDPIQALRGRGKGERLVEKLLESRREERERNESTSTSLHT